MADAFEVKGLKRLVRKLEDIRKDLFADELGDEIGMFIVARIEQRTLDGRDVKGNMFVPYSPSYKKARAKAGFPVDKVDLHRSGSMLSALTYEVEGETVKIFFQNTEDKSGTSNASKGFWLNEKRNFFGLSQEDEGKIRQMVLDHIDKIVGART